MAIIEKHPHGKQRRQMKPNMKLRSNAWEGGLTVPIFLQSSNQWWGCQFFFSFPHAPSSLFLCHNTFFAIFLLFLPTSWANGLSPSVFKHFSSFSPLPHRPQPSTHDHYVVLFPLRANASTTVCWKSFYHTWTIFRFRDQKWFKHVQMNLLSIQKIAWYNTRCNICST
jgi:hypothetical protein